MSNFDDKSQSRVSAFFQRKWVMIPTIIIIILVIIMGIARGYRNYQVEQGLIDPTTGEKTSASATPTTAIANPVTPSATASGYINAGTDKQLAQLQNSLNQKYGQPPQGYIWDNLGNPLSLGVADMSSEDVVYTYVQALSKLDVGVAQKLSRGTRTVATLSDFSNSKLSSSQVDLAKNYERDVLSASLLSMKNEGVETTSVYAENKRVYNVNITLIDLSDKTFWEKDRDAIMDTVYNLDRNQSDLTQAQQYVNNYVLDYYKSGEAKTRTVTVALTLEKYPDLNTGWLVSIDDDLNTYATLDDGKPVNEFIMSEYRQYKQQRMVEEKTKATS